MASREITANCAICGQRPQDSEQGDCPCETKALRRAIEQSEKKWIDSWMSRIHDWVTNAAVRYITTTFASLKDRRMRNYQAHVYSLPYYREYRQWRGRPPIHPELIQRLKAQLQSADQDLQTGVNQDWRACVLKYPEVLDYYYSQVEVALPGGAIDPPFGGHGAPTPGPGLGLSHAGSTKRKGARHSVPPETLGFEDLHIGGPPPAPRRRDSGSYILSGRNKAPTAPMPPAAPSYPPTFGFH